MSEVGKQIEGSVSSATLDELRSTRWPPSEADVERIAGVAGGAAAGAACAYVGAGAATPICVKIGKRISTWLADKTIGVVRRVFRRRGKAWRQYHAQLEDSAKFAQAFEAAKQIDRLVGAALTETVENLTELHRSLFASEGPDRTDWLILLGTNGAPLAANPGCIYKTSDGRCEIWPTLNATRRLTDSGLRGSGALDLIIVVLREAKQDLSRLDRAYYEIEAKMLARAASEEAARALKPKPSGVGPVLLAGAALGGVALLVGAR